MTKLKRDFSGEYRKRLERGLAKGLSRSAARGHARAGEASAKAAKPIPDDRLQIALKVLRKEGSISKAAKAVRIAPERLRAAASEAGLIEKSGRRWTISPSAKRSIEIFTDGRRKTVTVATVADASLAGEYRSAVGHFVSRPDPKPLVPFIGKSIRDIEGVEHPLETDPNVLYQLTLSGDHAAEHIYRIYM